MSFTKKSWRQKNNQQDETKRSTQTAGFQVKRLHIKQHFDAEAESVLRSSSSCVFVYRPPQQIHFLFIARPLPAVPRRLPSSWSADWSESCKTVDLAAFLSSVTWKNCCSCTTVVRMMIRINSSHYVLAIYKPLLFPRLFGELHRSSAAVSHQQLHILEERNNEKVSYPSVWNLMTEIGNCKDIAAINNINRR